MAMINSILAALDERHIAQQVGLHHDEVRMSYRLDRNTVRSFDEFSAILADYLNYHFAATSNGGTLPRHQAASQAKQYVEREYRRHDSDIVGAFNDARDGTNGGMRAILDTIAQALKSEAIEQYVRDVFDRHVAPSDWDTKMEIIRQFIAQSGPNLASSIRADQPERYAHNYQELIQSYARAIQSTAANFRRM